MRTRRRFSAEFKAKVAPEAIKGDETVAEPATKHGLHPTQIAAWKREAVEKLAKVFDGGRKISQWGRPPALSFRRANSPHASTAALPRAVLDW